MSYLRVNCCKLLLYYSRVVSTGVVATVVLKMPLYSGLVIRVRLNFLFLLERQQTIANNSKQQQTTSSTPFLECQSPHIHIIRFAFNDNKQKQNSLYRTVACKNDYSEEEREREREELSERGIERGII
jgi:hypothetical protein